MFKLTFLFLMSLTTAWTLAVSTARAQDLNVQDQVMTIGIDSMGKVRSIAIPKAEFIKNMNAALLTVKDSLLPQLAQSDAKPAANTPRYLLRTVGVGVGVSGQFGLGPLFNITFSPKVRLIFTNSTEPQYPD